MRDKLRQLGLTLNEARVYEELVNSGQTTVGPLSKNLRMHRQVVYDALSGLEEKNMIVEFKRRGRNNYKITSPRNILREVEKRELVARNLIEEIIEKQKVKNLNREVSFYEGEKAYTKLALQHDNLMPPNSKVRGIAGVAESYFNLSSPTGFFEKSREIRVIKNVKTQLLYNISLKKELKNLSKLNNNIEYRFLSQEYNSPFSISIWQDSVTLISFSEEIFAIDIKDKNIRDAYSDYFNLLWKTSKK